MGRSATKIVNAGDIKNLRVGGSVYGFNLKATRNKSGVTFYASFSISGRRYVERLGISQSGYTLKQANEAAALLRAKVERESRRQRDGDIESEITLKEAAKLYLEDVKFNQGKNYVAKEQQFRLHLLPHFGDWEIRKIYTQDVKAFRTKLVKQNKSLATVNRIMSSLDHFYRFAIEQRWVKNKPYALKKFEEHYKPRDRIPHNEKAALLEIARSPDQHPLIYLFVLIGFGTGMRHREILKMRWENIYWDRNEVWLPECKAGPRMQPLPEQVTIALRAKLGSDKNRRGYVFSADDPQKHITTMRDPFNRLCKAAGLAGKYTPHFMRHTAVSDMAEQGYNMTTIMKVSGHKTPAMVARYAHLNESDIVRAAVNSLLPT